MPFFHRTLQLLTKEENFTMHRKKTIKVSKKYTEKGKKIKKIKDRKNRA